jgi:hypothetical protein
MLRGTFSCLACDDYRRDPNFHIEIQPSQRSNHDYFECEDRTPNITWDERQNMNRKMSKMGIKQFNTMHRFAK